MEEILAGDPGPEAPAPEPEAHGPNGVDEVGGVPVVELPAHVQALIEQLAYRTLFQEAALTNLVRMLISNGILPRDYEERLIGEAEDIVEQTAGRHTEKGRAGLIAAFLDTTRTD